jgi:hypothetical protein
VPMRARDRIMSNFRAVTLAIILAIMASILWVPNAEAQTFSNGTIADAGLKEVGTRRATGWNQPGECIKSVQRWVAAAGGRMKDGGPVSAYTTSGAKQITLSTAVKGDVIQYTSKKDPDTDWTHAHTVVVIQNHGNGRYGIVQSNSPAGSGLVSRSRNWTPSPHGGWTARVWRLGRVSGGDFTGDGKADLAWYEQWQNAITVLKANVKGNGFTSAWKHSNIGGPTWAGVGDFTGDGRADIAWFERWQNAGTIAILKSTGSGFRPGQVDDRHKDGALYADLGRCR